MSSSSVVIVGDNWLFRRGLEPALHELKLAVVGEGHDVPSAFRGCERDYVPDVVLFVDYRLESTAASAAALRKTRQIGPGTVEVVVSDTNWTLEDQAMLGPDIDAILSSTLSCKMLVNALELIMAGHRIFARPPLRNLPSPAKAPPVNDHDVGAALATTGTTPTEANSKSTNQAWHQLRAKQAAVASVLPSSVWKSPPHLGTKPAMLVLEPCLPRLSQRERQTLRCLVIGQPNKAIANELGVAETTVKVHVKSLLRKLKAANRTQAAIWAINNSQLCSLDNRAANALDDMFALSKDSVMDGLDAELLGVTV